MSRNGTLLPIPAPLPEWAQTQVDAWPAYVQTGVPFPRSKWLSDTERLLALVYPAASSADRKLTARHLAPFPLALGSNVP